MDRQPVVDAFFKADKQRNFDALTELFLPDAVAKDEGATHTGIHAIRAWWEDAHRKYHHVAEPLETSVAGNKVTVRAKVSGQFPSSPATLNYFFRLEQGKIANLEIEP